MAIFHAYLKFLKHSKFRLLFVITYTMVIIVYVFFFLRVLPEREPRLSKYKSKLYEKTDKYLSARDPSSVHHDDIKVIFNSVDRESEGTLLKYGYISVLEDYLVRIISDSNKENDKFYPPVFAILESERKEEPYSNLPPEERRILINLENSVKSNDIEAALFNLVELNDILRINNESLDTLKKQNRWSIPLAIVGLFVTILFGIITVIRQVSFRKTES